MKKIMLALLLAGTLFACKKESNSNEFPASQSKVPVQFSLEDFLITQQDMSKNGRVAADPSLSGFYKVYYMLFANDGTSLNYIEQDSADFSHFGTISDSLYPGTYTVALGAWTRKSPNTASITTSHSSLDTAEFRNPLARNIGDLFYKKLQITVAKDTASINNVTLNRIIGNLTVDLKDALPASDTNGAVTVFVGGIPQSYKIKTDVATNSYQSISIDRTSQTTWQYNVLGSTKPLTVTLNWKDKVTGTPITKTISNVIVSANKRTIVTGYLYGVPTEVAGSFTLKTNQTWSSDSTVISIN